MPPPYSHGGPAVPALRSAFHALVIAVAVVVGGGGVGCATRGRGVGSVGAMLGKDVHTGRLFVREVPSNMAAAAAGVRDGDEVIAIDGAPVADLSAGEIHQRLEGTVGTTVVLLIVRDGESRKISIVRGPLEKR